MARVFLALILFPYAIVPNIYVLCSPPRAIAASDSEPLQQQSYVSDSSEIVLCALLLSCLELAVSTICR